MTKPQNTPDITRIADLNDRKDELQNMISEATSWGAYVSALGEELRNVERAIHRLEGNDK